MEFSATCAFLLDGVPHHTVGAGKHSDVSRFQEPKLAKSRSKDSKVSGMTKAWRSNKKLAQRDAAERAGNLSISKSWMLRGFDGTSLGIGLVTA